MGEILRYLVISDRMNCYPMSRRIANKVFDTYEAKIADLQRWAEKNNYNLEIRLIPKEDVQDGC